MVLLGILATIAFYAFAAVLMFGAAGRWDVPAFWAWLAFMAGSSVAVIPIVDRTSPGLIAERLRPGPGDRDRFGPAAAVVELLLTLGLAGLDARFRWSPVPPAVIGLAWAGVAAGFWITGWAMAVNRYVASAVRIQPDRGQAVVSDGPYAFVRHPGYTGGLLFMGCTGLALGSWWAALPSVPALAWFLRRTLIEDAMLRSELDGYDAYANRVRHRLVPGLW